MKVAVEVSLIDGWWKVKIGDGPAIACKDRDYAELLIADRVMTAAEAQFGKANADKPSKA